MGRLETGCAAGGSMVQRGKSRFIPEYGMGNDMSSANDIKAAEATYNSFIGLVKVAVPILAVLTIVVVKLISS